MTVDYFRRNFHWAVFWGIVLQIAGGFMHPLQNFPFLAAFGWLTTLIGTVILLIGFAFYLRAKGRHIAWCLLALLPIIGWIFLILLKDKGTTPLPNEICN